MNQKNIYLLKDLAWKSRHSIYTIKYYLKLNLIAPAGRGPYTRFQYFDDSTVAKLRLIRRLRKNNKTLSAIKKLLEKKQR